jgi:hypothetical protein
MSDLLTIVVVVLMMLLYFNNKLDCVLEPIEYTISRIHGLISPKENYKPCPPSDCDRYRVRKDQLAVRNPFLWPWSGSDEPQYAVPYDEVNRIADQEYKINKCWRSRPVINCGDCRCKHPFKKNRDNPLDNKMFALDN